MDYEYDAYFFVAQYCPKFIQNKIDLIDFNRL